MVEIIPVIIDSVTACLELRNVTRKKVNRPQKVKTQINNYYVTINQNSTTTKETVTKPSSDKKPVGTDLNNSEMLFLMFVFFAAMVAVLRFYCRWVEYINALFSLIVLVASLGYQAVTHKYVFDRKTQIKHLMIFVYPVLFHLASLIIGYFIDINTTYEQYSAVYNDTFGASIRVWFDSVNPASAMMYVFGQLAFILSVLFGLIMLAVEIYLTCSTKERPKWLNGLFQKYDIASITTPLCFAFLIASLVFYPFLQRSV